MAGLSDYSGEFDPEFSHDNFSKDVLLKLLEAYREYILRIDGFWYLASMEKWGRDEAYDCDIKVWEKALPFELKAMTDTMNIHGNDVAAVMKYMQVNPWLSLCEYTINMKTHDHAILTKYTCPTLFALEKEGKGREKYQCQEISPWTFETISHFFNPKIEVTGLSVPPRTDCNDICCQWEFKLDR